MARENGDTVESVVRALRLLQAFGPQNPVMTPAQASRQVGCSRATARRILKTLESEGFANESDRGFHLTPRVLRLGYGYISSLSIPDLALAEMTEVVDKSGESCSLGVLDGGSVVFVGRVVSSHPASIRRSVGSRLPAFATALGRVLLAGLDDEALTAVLSSESLEKRTPQTQVDVDSILAEIARTRVRGWGVSDGESETGVRAAAVPIRNNLGEIVAAMNVAASTARVSMESLEFELLPILLEAAKRLEGIAIRRVGV